MKSSRYIAVGLFGLALSLPAITEAQLPDIPKGDIAIGLRPIAT